MASLREILDAQRKKKEIEHQTPIVPKDQPPNTENVAAAAPAVVEVQRPNVPANAVPQKAGGFTGRFKKSVAEQSVKPPEQSVQTPAPIPAEKPAPIIPEQKRVDNAQVVPVQPTAPPDLLDEGLAELRRNLDFLANNIEQKELVGQVVRTIAVQLAENPQFSSHMQKADFNLIVRGLRKSFNVQARKKVEGGEKRQKNAALSDEYAKMVGDLGISF